jgi:hypothetical protein
MDKTLKIYCKVCGLPMGKMPKQRNSDYYGYWYCQGSLWANAAHVLYMITINLLGFDDIGYGDFS